MRDGLPAPLTARTVRALSVTGLCCAVIFVIGLFSDTTRTRVWSGYLIGFNVLVGLAVAGPMFLALLNISGARWARAMQPVLRAAGAALPAAAGVGLILLFGVSSLFEWSHPSAVAGDAVLEKKAIYLNTPAFGVRLVVFFALWTLLARWLVRATEGNADDDPQTARRRRIRAGAVFLIVFAPTWSLAGIDWQMSLEPHWFSSIFALRTLSGVALAGLGAATVLVVALRRAGPLALAVREKQLNDIGVLMLSFALFWAYIWYSQYMLVWYTNMPEETFWFASRMNGAWELLSYLALVLNFVIPFTVMLFGAARRNEKALVRVAIVLLVGRLVDLLVIVGPPLMGDAPRIGIWELAPVVGSLALFFLLAVRALGGETAGAARPQPAATLAPAA